MAESFSEKIKFSNGNTHPMGSEYPNILDTRHYQ